MVLEGAIKIYINTLATAKGKLGMGWNVCVSFLAEPPLVLGVSLRKHYIKRCWLGSVHKTVRHGEL